MLKVQLNTVKMSFICNKVIHSPFRERPHICHPYSLQLNHSLGRDNLCASNLQILHSDEATTKGHQGLTRKNRRHAYNITPKFAIFRGYADIW